MHELLHDIFSFLENFFIILLKKQMTHFIFVLASIFKSILKHLDIGILILHYSINCMHAILEGLRFFGRIKTLFHELEASLPGMEAGTAGVLSWAVGRKSTSSSMRGRAASDSR